MPAFDCLGDPARRRILGPRIGGERAGGEVGIVSQDEFWIFQAGVSRSSCGCCETMDSRPSGPSASDG